MVSRRGVSRRGVSIGGLSARVRRAGSIRLSVKVVETDVVRIGVFGPVSKAGGEEAAGDGGL